MNTQLNYVMAQTRQQEMQRSAQRALVARSLPARPSRVSRLIRFANKTSRPTPQPVAMPVIADSIQRA